MLRKYALILLGLFSVFKVDAYQIAPSGSAFESRLTNEKESSLIKAAGTVGVLLKAPVHEEITQLAFECIVDAGNLAVDKECAGANKGFANHFVIYGVRWNDLPPFRLDPKEGNCSYLGQNVCRIDQTVRFSTQPICWYCLFVDAEKTAQKKKIAGCRKEANTVPGNLMTRSHFGDLQFLHAMATEPGEAASVTQAKILGWAEFTWKVAMKEIKPETPLRNIPIPVIQEHFGCTEWRVVDIYLLGRQDPKIGLLQQIHQIAFGSLMHTVQDSFARAHTSRELVPKEGACPNTSILRPPRIVEFHTYAAQDGKLHDAEDARTALVGGSVAQGWPQAVVASRELARLYQDRTSWDTAKQYIQCLFETVENPTNASPGKEFERTM